MLSLLEIFENNQVKNILFKTKKECYFKIIEFDLIKECNY